MIEKVCLEALNLPVEYGSYSSGTIIRDGDSLALYRCTEACTFFFYFSSVLILRWPFLILIFSTFYLWACSKFLNISSNFLILALELIWFLRGRLPLESNLRSGNSATSNYSSFSTSIDLAILLLFGIIFFSIYLKPSLFSATKTLSVKTSGGNFVPPFI